MRIILTILCCLYAISSSSQVPLSNENDGVYAFHKMTHTIYNYETKAVVSSVTIEDASLIDSTNFHYENVIIRADIYNGGLFSCVLTNNRMYRIENNMELTLMEEKKAETSVPHDETALHTANARSGDVRPPVPLQLRPYTLVTEGNKLTLITEYPFGDSRYNFPLESKIVVELLKQESR